MSDNEIVWNAKHDIFRGAPDYSDLAKIVTCYYEMYAKATEFVGPWIAKQRGMIFLSPEKDQVKEALGKDRPFLNFRIKNAFIDSLIQFLDKTKGKRTLITPSPSTHHSAQFPYGTFEINLAKEPIPVKTEKGLRLLNKNVFELSFAGAERPVYIENLRIPPAQIRFIIVRPKMGKLGTPNLSRWEVLLYKKNHTCLVDHVDSNLNPRFSGIF